MVSKEDIKLIRELYNYAMWDFHTGNLDEMTDKDIAVGKAIDNVEKDLEVLEILKNHLFIRIEDARDEIYAVILQENEEPQLGYTCIFVSKEEKEIIKEWLTMMEEIKTQDTTDEKKCFGDIKPADIPYDEYMNVVRENEELKETIVKLVKKLNGCLFFD